MSACQLAACVGLSTAGYFLCCRLIQEFHSVFVERRLFGFDKSKPPAQRDVKVPEPMGVVIAVVYLAIMFLLIPVLFTGALFDEDPTFPHHKFVEYLAGLLSICTMVLLGFADDVLDLRWRHKLLLPSLASLPLLLVYAANHNSTTVVLPLPLAALTGHAIVNLHLFYYLYLGMLAVFATNAINIYAGVNGLECGQSIIIALSVVAYNAVQLLRGESQPWYHYLSLFFLLPYLAASAALLRFNWYPSRVFVGDTFCYTSGMLFAVVAVLGHFSKTLLLFFIPQIVNFVYSTPQLFRLLNCPRHRLPKYDAQTDLMTPSITAPFNPAKLNVLTRLIVTVLSKLRLLRLTKVDEENYVCNNLTLINLIVLFSGPLHERSLVKRLLALQVICSLFAFAVRFLLAGVLYNRVE